VRFGLILAGADVPKLGDRSNHDPTVADAVGLGDLYDGLHRMDNDLVLTTTVSQTFGKKSMAYSWPLYGSV